MKPLRSKHYLCLGDPIPLNRPRHSKNGYLYDTQKHLKLAFGITVMNQHGNEPMFTDSIGIDIVLYHDIMKVALKKRPEFINRYHKYTPDIDNCVKFIFDSLNKVVIYDDCLIGALKVIQVYSDVPRTEFTIYELRDVIFEPLNR